MNKLMVRIAATVPALSATVALAATPPQPLYRVTVLSTAIAQGRSINNLGFIAGSLKTASGATHAGAWAFGHQLDLGTLGSGAGLNSRVLWPVKNNLGLVSGISLTDQLDPNREGWSCGAFLANPNFNVCRGFLWEPRTGKMRALPTLGGTNGFATGTNDLGETVGWAENTVHDRSCIAPQLLQFKPVIWGPGRDQVHALPLAAGDSAGAATALNDRGQIVGISGNCGVAVGATTARVAVLWDNGTLIELVNPNGAPYWNTPMMINERGDVVGFAGVPNDPEGNLTPPFMWTRPGGWKFIPMLAGEVAGVATSINMRGQIVGYSSDASGAVHPWIRDHGVTRNLNDLLETAGSGLTGPAQFAFDINDAGAITGRSTTGQAFVAVPIGAFDD